MQVCYGEIVGDLRGRGRGRGREGRRQCGKFKKNDKKKKVKQKPLILLIL